MHRSGRCLALVVASALMVGCDGGDTATDAGVDGGGCRALPTPMLGDAGPVPGDVMCTAPDGGVPGEGPCCYLDSQADSLDAPELRLRFIRIHAPVDSPLTTAVLLGVLNDALGRSTFNWLYRVEGAGDGGAVEIVTGFGIRNPDTGTFRFPEPGGGTMFDVERYLPIRIQGTMSGEVVTSSVYPGSLTVPVLNTEGTSVQLELTLRNIRVIGGEFNTNRSCVGYRVGAMAYATAAYLDAFIEVGPARMGEVRSGSVVTTVCAAIAGSLTDGRYCEDVPQAEWAIPPDSYCDESGCTANTGCEEDVCDRGNDSATGLPGCNAWRIVASFAAQGVEITN